MTIGERIGQFDAMRVRIRALWGLRHNGRRSELRTLVQATKELR